MKQETALGILKTGRNVYITGAAGAGKTHVLNEYIEFLKKHNVGVGVTASTGIAATHLNGMTIHSWSGIGIKDFLTDFDIDALTQRQSLVKRFERTNVLLVDEVSMLRPEILDMIDQVSRAMKRSEESFGGMQVVLCGDFFQLPPVVRGGNSDSFADSAQAWIDGDFRICYLTEQYRQKGGKLLNILNDIRDGEISVESQESLESRMKAGAGHNEKVGNNETPHIHDAQAVVLHTHNTNVDVRNYEELSKLDTESVSFEMVSTGRANLVESLKKNVLAPVDLELKVGARVMFVKNSKEREYVNGTLGEVIDLNGSYPIVKTNSGKKIMAHPVSWEMIDDGKVLASVTQVPLRLAWAITVHKSQGMSLDKVEVDLSRAFTPGQGYVALSRARTLNGLILHGLNSTALRVHPYVQDRDGTMQAESNKWEKIFNEFTQVKISELQKDFIKKVGRTKSEVEKDKPIPTHLKTRSCLERSESIESIAKGRGMTKGTIISHLEKLKDSGDTDIFSYLTPSSVQITKIKKAFEKSEDTKLTPVHRILKGKYSYDELRLARLFI